MSTLLIPDPITNEDLASLRAIVSAGRGNEVIALLEGGVPITANRLMDLLEHVVQRQQSETKRFLVIVEGDIEPEIRGPYAGDDERDVAAKAHRAGDPDKEDGIFPLDITTTDPNLRIEIDTYSGGFFEEE